MKVMYVRKVFVLSLTQIEEMAEVNSNPGQLTVQLACWAIVLFSSFVNI